MAATPSSYRFWSMEVFLDGRNVRLVNFAQNAVHARKRMLASVNPNRNLKDGATEKKADAFVTNYSGESAEDLLKGTSFTVTTKKTKDDAGVSVTYDNIKDAVSNGWLEYEHGSVLLVSV